MNKEFLDSFHHHYASDAYNFLGAFYNEDATTFRVYAPHAECVSVVGDFNYWNPEANYMNKIDDEGIYELTIPNLHMFDNYKYAIKNHGVTFLKQDPYGYHFETNGNTSSKLYPMNNYGWNDTKWMKNRNQKNLYSSPINIYEAHIGSWMKCDGNDMNYRDIAVRMVDYVKKMGYNYIELLPIMEHPFLGSWGYQVTGYYGVTSRYGVPDDFKYFVDYAHQNNIGVILDWVPAHFPKDDFALFEFDGDKLYEDPNPLRMEHKSWGTRIFNFAKPEVKSFLISSACFYFDKYHIDGIRVDAVAAMLYLDYDRKEWQPNIYGGNHNLEAIGFLQDLNMTCFNKFGNILMIAEESTAFAGVTKPVNMGGLGFNYKWNMGWMNDTLSYIKVDPYFKGDIKNKITFPMTYAYSENYVLAISHDEVVHCKKSLLDKMPGDYNDKFANLRTYLGFMLTHPGKKLVFMGAEFGQFIEWNEAKELDWNLLTYPSHQGLQKYVCDLNNFYLNHSELYEIEDSWNGFIWVELGGMDGSTFSYIRRNKEGKELLVLINFSGLYYDDYELQCDALFGKYRVIFASDAPYYGGESKYLYGDFEAIDGKLRVSINKFSFIILEKFEQI